MRALNEALRARVLEEWKERVGAARLERRCQGEAADALREMLDGMWLEALERCFKAQPRPALVRPRVAGSARGPLVGPRTDSQASSCVTPDRRARLRLSRATLVCVACCPRAAGRSSNP